MRRRLGTVLAMLLVAAWIAGSTSAQTTALPPASFADLAAPGTHFIWRDTRTGNTNDMIVGERDGYLVRFSFSGWRREAFGFFTWFQDGLKDRAKSSIAGFWPLELGKFVSYRRMTDDWTVTDTVAVVGIETVTVPAGTFEAYVISYRSRGPDWAYDATRWYAPALGWTVKIQGSGGGNPDFGHELVRIERR